MSNFVLILGATGSGKSTSIKTLNPKETVVLSVINKDLPFPKSRALYNEENKNRFFIPSWDGIISYMDSISNNAKAVKNIIIDDATYIMRNEFFNRVDERGYDKYNDIANHFKSIIAKAGALRGDLNVFMLLHTEPVESEGTIVGYKSSSVGKLLDKLYRPEENVTITLYAQPKFDDKGNPIFGFFTHKMRVNGIEVPAKTPDGMFKDDFIPNDLGLVVKTMNEYYG